MSAPRRGRLLRTLWYLRAEQVASRLRRRLGGGVRPRRAAGSPPRLRLLPPAVPFLPPPAHVAAHPAGRVRLLNREVRFLPGQIDWDLASHGPLWAYHLHQMEWLRVEALAPELRLRVLLDWIERHPRGVGWQGGPVSLRTFVWVKLLATPGALPGEAAARERLARSLADQLSTLAAHLERHLLGNHYLWNLLALVLGGIVLEGSDSARWLAHTRALYRQLDEQILADGAHCERSPMYHALLLENLLDLLDVARSVPERAPAGLAERLESTAAGMLGALRVFTHPDGEIALFGDSAFGSAARPDALFRYAEALGVAPRPAEREGVLADAGFVRLAQGPFSLLASLAGPMPGYQPGHAHCDALSFELAVAGERVVADTGVAEYVPGPLREASRATRSHATLQIDGQEQAELWGAHRIGGRPSVAMLAVQPGRTAEGVCSGWATPELLHRRSFAVEAEGVHVEDRLSGPPLPVTLHLPLAPGLEPRLADGRARLALVGGRVLSVRLPEGVSWSVVRTPYFSEFGRSEERAALRGEAPRLERARWHFTLE